MRAVPPDSGRLPEVSVIVPVYNRAETIAACVDSLLRSEYPAERREIIVVDNGSTDATPAVLERYGTRIVRVDEARRGPSAARNAGLRVAGGTVAAFTDSDCVVAPDWLHRLVPSLEDPSVGAVGGRILALSGGNRVEQFGERIHDHRKAIEVFQPPYVITMNLAARLAVLRELELFDERLLRYEDVDLAWRLTRAGYRLTYVHEAVIRHRNPRTLRALFAQGYAHGYHSVMLRRLYGPDAERTEPDRPAPPPEYSRDLPRAEEAFYSLVFRTGKRLGRTMASRRGHLSSSWARP